MDSEPEIFCPVSVIEASQISKLCGSDTLARAAGFQLPTSLGRTGASDPNGQSRLWAILPNSINFDTAAKSPYITRSFSIAGHTARIAP